jgi:hypothetical protein
MRLAIFPVLFILHNAIAAPIPKSSSQLAARDIQVVANALTNVSRELNILENGMRSRPRGGTIDEARRITDDLLAQSRRAIDVLREGARDIRRGPNLKADEGLTLIPTLNTMTKQLQAASDGWTNAKDMAVAAGMKAAILNMMLDASEGVIVFADVVIGKLPYIEQPLGRQYQRQFAEIIERCIKVYQW